MQEPRSGLTPGDTVFARRESWRVTEVRPFDDCELLRLAGVEPANAGTERLLLFPFDRPTRRDLCSPPHVVTRRCWIRALAAHLSEVTPPGRLRAAWRAAIDLAAFQLEPALAIVGGLASRVLLADEVGLGKTIQAGVILLELSARGEADRVLILTPSGLRDQWVRELANRFRIEASIIDAPQLAELVSSLPRGMNPWALAGVRIVSFDFLKRPEVLRSVEALLWDLIIVDEAHVCAGSSQRGEAMRALATRGRRVVLLTATPHSGDESAFSSLCDTGRLARQGDDGPILLFRRSRASVGLDAHRRTHLLPVVLTEHERRMHELLDRYARQVWREAASRGDESARLTVTVLKKRALSSARSLALSVARRLERLSGGSPAAWQLALPLGGEESDDDLARDAFEGPGLANEAHERAWLGAILAAATTASRRESKVHRLIRLLRRVHEPAIVFTEYRDTLDELARLIGRISRYAVLHGGLSEEERLRSERAFTSGASPILLATDAGSKGLNLQERCRLVISLELPWTPDRLEQRIGRVDRLGQRRAVHAIHLLAAGTAETDVLARLLERLARVREAVGVSQVVLGAASERSVAGAIIDGQSLPSPPAAGFARTARFTRMEVASDDAQDEVARLDRLRRLAARAKESLTSPIAAEPCQMAHIRLRKRAGRGYQPDMSAFPSGLLCIFRVRLHDGSGREVDRVLIPVHAAPASPDVRAPRGLADLRLIGAAVWACRSRMADVARHAAAVQLVPAHLAHVQSARAWERRELMLGEEVDRSLARHLVQLNLFDRRALREREQAESRAAQLRREQERRRKRLSEAANVTASDPELVLIAVVSTY